MKNDDQFVLYPIEDDAKASEAIYTQIRDRIISGEIDEGSRLPSERKLMEMAGRSRSTIREAMRMLESDGYIRTEPRSKGAIVQNPGLDMVVETIENTINMQNMEFGDILEFRRLTETTAARLAARRRTDADIKNMGQIVNKTSSSIGEIDEFVEQDFQFHMCVARASQNNMFEIMLTVCRNIIGQRLHEILAWGNETERENRYRDIAHVHEKIYRAISEGDENTAFREMEAHLMAAELDILKNSKKI